MIIVEGPDGSGKTHLVNSLLSAFPHLELHPKFVQSDMSGRGDLINKVAEDMTTVAKGYPTHLIYDRHPLISEYIYSTAIGRKLPEGFVHPVARAFRTGLIKRGIIIVCLPPFEEVEDNVFGGRVEQPPEIRWCHTGIYTGYEAFLVNSPHPDNLYVHDYTRDGSLADICGVVNLYSEGTAPHG